MEEEKIKNFYTEYEELTKKHGIDFANYPVFVPDGSGGFKVIVQSTPVDISARPVKSPFVTEK